jgi:hypothetical protein
LTAHNPTGPGRSTTRAHQRGRPIYVRAARRLDRQARALDCVGMRAARHEYHFFARADQAPANDTAHRACSDDDPTHAEREPNLTVRYFIGAGPVARRTQALPAARIGESVRQKLLASLEEFGRYARSYFAGTGTRAGRLAWHYRAPLSFFHCPRQRSVLRSRARPTTKHHGAHSASAARAARLAPTALRGSRVSTRFAR